MHNMNDRITPQDLAALAEQEAQIRALPSAPGLGREADAVESVEPLTESDEYGKARWQSECDGAIVIEFSTCEHPSVRRCEHHASEVLADIGGELMKRKVGMPEDHCPYCDRLILDCWKLDQYATSFALSHPLVLMWGYHSQGIER